MKGCPLNCWWCHNPESRLFAKEASTRHVKLGNKVYDQPEITGEWMTPEMLCSKVLSDLIFYDESSGGVTFSGGEPLLQLPFLKESLRLLKENGVHTTVDTCGYAPERDLREILEMTDLFLYDLKLMDDSEHQNFCGVSNQLILSNLSFLLVNRKSMVIRFPVIPGINDSMENVNAMIRFLAPYMDQDLHIDLLPYHTLAKEKYTRFDAANKMVGLADLTKEALIPIQEKFQTAGFKVRIGG
jgi:pyruvate formate lyase activating enzyme